MPGKELRTRHTTKNKKGSKISQQGSHLLWTTHRFPGILHSEGLLFKFLIAFKDIYGKF